MNELNVKNAGYAIRFLAMLEELFLSGITYFGLMYLILLGINENNLTTKTADVVVYILLFIFLSAPICALYNAFFISKFGGTLGKLAFRLKIKDENTNDYLSFKKAFYRTVLGYIFSTKFFGLGFLQIVRRQNRRAWHDDLFETKVVSEKNSWLGYLILLLSFTVMGALIYLNVVTILPLF